MPVFADASVVGDGAAYHGCGEESEEFHNDFVGINSLTFENLVELWRRRRWICGTLCENL